MRIRSPDESLFEMEKFREKIFDNGYFGKSLFEMEFWGKKLRKSSTFVFKTDFFGKNFCNKLFALYSKKPPGTGRGGGSGGV